MSVFIPALVPQPTGLELTGGWFALAPQLRIGCDPGAEDCAELLAEYLQVTGRDVRTGADPAGAGIALRIDRSDPDAGAEGYRLVVTPDGVLISAAAVAGLRHGIQTLRQLLPPQIYARRPAPDAGWRVPCVQITDAPRLQWRGSLLDVGRWFMPLDYLRQYIEVLAIHKMNRFHLHLTEDHGWRFEVQRYPELTRTGAWRSESEIGAPGEHRYDGTAHGGCYTQAELRGLVAFAARRGIEIVPEIDMPGHVTAAIAAYPELGNSGERLAVSRDWRIHTSVLNVEESTLRFFEDVLEEVIDVFPAPWIHIGGDECPTAEWEASAAAHDRVRELGLSGVDQLQEWFSNRICAYLRSRSKTPIVWDEAATARLDRDVVVMAWRSEQLGIGAAQRGHQVIMSPMQYTYFDWYQSDAPDHPLAHEGLTTLETAYGYDPRPDGLAAEVRDRIIGTQGQLWTEYLPTPQRVDEMAYPRLCALAERAWSGAGGDYADFVNRLGPHLQRLVAAGVAHG